MKSRPNLIAFLISITLLLTLSVQLPAQSGNDPYALVIYAEGYNMSVFRNDELTSYDVLVDDVIGMPLLPGDLVQTDDGTFVEMQVMPSRTVVKIAENTTFEIENIGGAGGGTFNMSYGRLRARVERITQDERFEIRGFSAVAGVRGTDFGYDMVVEREATSEMQTKVYVFEGEVEVSEAAAAEDLPGTAETEGIGESSQPAGRPEPVRIRANEMVNVISEVPEEIASRADEIVEGGVSESAPIPPSSIAPTPRKVVFQQRRIENEIEQFWDQKDFQEEAVDPDRVEEKFPGINARVQRLSEERRRYEELQRLRREGLLGADQDEYLVDTVTPIEEEVEREPDELALGEPGPSERIERMVAPDRGLSQSKRLVRTGHWMVGVGLALEVAGLAGAWYVDDARSVQEINPGAPSTGLMIGGGVFISSGLFSYLLSLGAE